MRRLHSNRQRHSKTVI